MEAKKSLLPPSLPPRAPGLPPTLKPPKAKNGMEAAKETSNYLRGTIAEDLAGPVDHFNEAGINLLKFHGLYQQDDRDLRGAERIYSFMVRSRLPGGRLTADQYLIHDRLADEYGNRTLRITTRQGFQLHGVIKTDLKGTLNALNQALVTTMATCGDVVRNVMAPPAPARLPWHNRIDAVAQTLSTHFLPQTKAYHEIWLEGEPLYDGKEHVETFEPIYGSTYLPRKFKIGIAYPGDNSVDVYTQDVGLIAVVEGDELIGFNVLVGGGLGMTHRKAETFPRLGDLLAFVREDELVAVVENIVKVQRDNGDRTNRKHARLKYLIHEWGIERFRAEVEKRLGYTLQDPRPNPPLDLELHLGRNRQADGLWWLGISVENGRIKDTAAVQLKTALREVVSRFRPNITLTPSHDLLLTDLREEDLDSVETLLAHYGVPGLDEISTIRKYSMACPALPTCGLAIAESERVLPDIISRIEEDLRDLGLAQERITIRMTGCPNGCARPYVADVGLVGRSLRQYSLFLGGRADGTRINKLYQDLVNQDEIAATLRPLFLRFRDERLPGESFGDFAVRALLTPTNEEHHATA